MKRPIIHIDETKCDGCGLCVPACREGAIQIVDGKARLVRESYCDGLGECLGHCPQGAITMEEREAEAFDAEAVELAGPATRVEPAAPARGPVGGCPGSRILSRPFEDTEPPAGAPAGGAPSHLRQWPVQLHLVPVEAPFWQDADVLVAADCTAFALGDFHERLLKGRRLVNACPKLDETSTYVGKLAAIFARNDIRSVTVAVMEVPCCGGMMRMVEAARAASGKDLPLRIKRVSLDGQMVDVTDLVAGAGRKVRASPLGED